MKSILILACCLFCSRLTASDLHTPAAGTPEHAGFSLASDTGEAKDKVTAIFLAATVGVLGVHRWYLGTSIPTLAVYALTFGGFGIVVIMDIVELLRADDLTPYLNNPRFFMWNLGKEPTGPH